MELSCPAPKHCEYGRKMASAASEPHETPRLSATFSSHDPFKTARLNQAGRKNKLRHSCGVTATPYTAFCETKKPRAFKPPEIANSGGPVPVARSRWPARSRPGPGGPVPVARSRWPVPVARSWWPSPGPALRACSRGPA